MSDELLDAAGLRGLLATILAGATDRSEAEWAELIGKDEVLPIVFNPRCNWSVSPSGTSAQRDAIGKAIELVRAEYPYISSTPDGR